MFFFYPCKSIIERRVGFDIGMNGVVAEDFAGTGDVSAGGENQRVAIGEGIRYVCAGIACGGKTECAGVGKPPKGEQGGFAGTGCEGVRKQGDGALPNRLYEAFAWHGATIPYLALTDVLDGEGDSPLTFLETEAYAVRDEG